MRIFIITLFFFLSIFTGKASHVMGGGITYECVNGEYVFELVYYRDCNGADVTTISQNLRVWNHPTLSNITLNYSSREDISPVGTQVPGGQPCFACGVGASGGNGIGAIEKVIYRSAPTVISGVPPAQGWVFTFDDFSRNGTITNLQNASSYGVTLSATIFDYSNPANTCVDNSPKFLQEPYFVSCAGKPYQMNLNPVDPDLDSIVVEFDTPLNNFTTGTFNPPTNPIAVPFEVGFSTNSPTPGTSFNPGNIPAQLDPTSGELTFTSFTLGSYIVKLKVKSYRNKQLISIIDREMQLIVTNCTGTNNPPIVAAPFGASFETTVNAGSLVNFTISSTDLEFLQDGSLQTNLINPSGIMFGTNFTSTLGCNKPPCATLSSPPIITGNQGATVDFSWQTDCLHLTDANGNGLDKVPYHFVFRVQDDYCAVPEVIYKTVTINVVNPGIIAPPSIQCIQGNATNYTINWDVVDNSQGTFVAYEVYSLQDGLIATINNINTTSYTDINVTQGKDYYVSVVSGCNGNATRYSDTISAIYLDLSNANPSIAELNWNDPIQPALPGMNQYYYILREYPAGIWSIIDSIPYGTTFYEDTIDICSVFLNYQIVLNTSACAYSSLIEGDQFNDQIPPNIPNVSHVTVDTITGLTSIFWDQNTQEDTYGYLIYVQDPLTGLLVELDTVYGIANTSYTYLANYSNGALTYTVAAFDSCPSMTGAPFNLSARDPNFNTGAFQSMSIDICAAQININWTPYIGWDDDILNYEVFVLPENGLWQSIGTTTNLNYSYATLENKNYCFVIKTTHVDGRTSFSPRVCVEMKNAPRPSYSYLSVATVTSDDKVRLKYNADPSSKLTELTVERLRADGTFKVIETIPNPNFSIEFIDENVFVQEEIYTYQLVYSDSCGIKGLPSNIGQTILLTVQTDEVALQNYLTWNPYADFNGAVIRYEIYRGINGVIDPTPIAEVSNNTFSFYDDMNEWDFNGKVCYRVDAVEGSNIFSTTEVSQSNVACSVVEPLIYVPNAFYPDGINKTFYPVITNFDATDYLFTIFNRWGQVVFQTNNYFEPWNGQLNNSGQGLETGTYVYMVEVHDGDGNEIVKRGHVSLLR